MPRSPAEVRPVPVTRAPTPPATAAEHRRIALAVQRRANDVRADARAAALTEDEALTKAAQLYAEELARLQRIEHYSPTRGLETMTKRIEAAGGTWRRAAENLATTYNITDIPKTVIDMWLRSPSHRQSLLDGSFRNTGVGVARDARGAWYIVQLYVQKPVRR